MYILDMPAPEKIRLPSVVYIASIQNGEMDTIYTLIQAKKDEISTLSSQLTLANSELSALQYQYITLYIQATGQFPPTS